MIDIACDLLAELQAAQARIEHLAQRALDEKRAHDFLKRHSRWRQDNLLALMGELERFDAEQFSRLRMTLGDQKTAKTPPFDEAKPKPNPPLTVSTIQTAIDSNVEELNKIFDTEIPPPLSNPLTLFIDNEDEQAGQNSVSDVSTPNVEPEGLEEPPVQKTDLKNKNDVAVIQPTEKKIPEAATKSRTNQPVNVDLSAQIENNPSDASVWIKRAKEREDRGDTVGAISDYLRAANRSSNAVEIWTALLALYEEKGLSVKAQQAKEKLNALEGD